MGTYLIIGASSGIGASTLQKLKAGGHNVVASYRNNVIEKETGVEPFRFEVGTSDNSLIPLPDVLDGFIYLPGSINLKPFHKITAAEFVDDYKLQVAGAIDVLQHILPSLKASDSSSIVLMSTVAVRHGFPYHSQVSSSKGAIEGLIQALSAELAPKIRVNGIAPSITKTQLSDRFLNTSDKIESNAQRHPLKMVGEPDIIAEAAYYLLTERSKWTTGQILTIDGGISQIKH